MASYNSGSSHPKFIDLKGKVFGNLTILEYTRNPNTKAKEWCWKAECSCGNITYSRTRQFTKEKPQSSCQPCARQECGRKLSPEVDKITAGFNKQFYRYRKSAESRKLPFEINRETFDEIVVEDCYYCGSEPTTMGHDYPIIANGIDRVDSKRGYTLDNVVPCCRICNTMKMALPLSEWLGHINKIVKEQEKQNNDHF